MGAYAVAVCLTLTLSSYVLCLRIPTTLSPDTISSSSLAAAACHPSKQPHPRTLRSDQFTVLINGYSKSRLPLLQSIAATYSASPLVSSMLVLWDVEGERRIGIFVRSHDIDMTRKEWIYTVHPDKYSIVLTKFMMMKGVFVQVQLRRWAPMREMRRMVDEMFNCEDILMNFEVAEQKNAGPLILGAEKARDWEDPRNEDYDA
ncbi:hypothetical protein REPUB_Repub01dG0051000 [Reevesia pubescens]